MLIIQVAIPSPLRRHFDYLPCTGAGRQSYQAGTRVKVPLGKRQATGIIIGTAKASAVSPDKLKPITRILDAEPALDGEILSLCRWASNYYQHPLGQVLQASLPREARLGKPLQEPLETVWRLTDQGREQDLALVRNAPRQVQVLRLLSERPQLSGGQLKSLIAAPPAAFLKALEAKGLVERAVLSPAPEGGQAHPPEPPLALNREQEQAKSKILASLHGFNVFLLEGVTGSGKTEVYLQLIARVLELGKQVLVLVPEIGLTPQTIARFRKRFPHPIVAFHSALASGARLSAWLRARNGEASIVIGTRSAVFTPLSRLGLVIVDEEHDGSYKQQEGFRYSGRDLAICRAQQAGIPVVLGSATPSLESLRNALRRRYQHLHLTQRAGGAVEPACALVDLKGQTLEAGFSPALLDAVKVHLERGNQVLIFINRRGFAPILLCQQCGWIASCPRCETSYTVHLNPPHLNCHHCEARRGFFAACARCGGKKMTALGLGTERSEQSLRKLFPDVPIHRIDRDSTRRRNALARILAQVHEGGPCILVGTQMLSKGHHFPKVTLAAILDADSGLFSADFRGQENMGQLVTQVAGRAGRGAEQGMVMIQTYNDGHPTLRTLVAKGYSAFARTLLGAREKGRLPPFTSLALLRAEAKQRSKAEEFLAGIRRRTAGNLPASLRYLGPMPAPLEKRGGLFRMQIIIEAGRRPALQKHLPVLAAALEAHPQSRKVKWFIDVDPIDLA